MENFKLKLIPILVFIKNCWLVFEIDDKLEHEWSCEICQQIITFLNNSKSNKMSNIKGNWKLPSKRDSLKVIK